MLWCASEKVRAVAGKRRIALSHTTSPIVRRIPSTGLCIECTVFLYPTPVRGTSLVFFLALQYDFDTFHYLTRLLALSMLAVKLRHFLMWPRSISFASTHTGQIEEPCIPILFRWRCRQSREMIRRKLAAKTLLGTIDGILFSGIVSQALPFTCCLWTPNTWRALFLVILQLSVGRWSALQETANVMHLWPGCRPCHCGVSHIGSGSTRRLSQHFVIKWLVTSSVVYSWLFDRFGRARDCAALDRGLQKSPPKRFTTTPSGYSV